MITYPLWRTSCEQIVTSKQQHSAMLLWSYCYANSIYEFTHSNFHDKVFIAMFTTIQPMVFNNSLIITGSTEQFPLEQTIRVDWKFEKDIWNNLKQIIFFIHIRIPDYSILWCMEKEKIWLFPMFIYCNKICLAVLWNFILSKKNLFIKLFSSPWSVFWISYGSSTWFATHCALEILFTFLNDRTMLVRTAATWSKLA